MYPDPFNALASIPPWYSIEKLNDIKSQLTSTIPDLDTTQTFSSVEIEYDPPEFKEEPVIPGNVTGLTYVTFTCSLKYSGNILAILIEESYFDDIIIQ